MPNFPLNHNLHNRQSIRLKNYDYSSAGLYFITICVKDRHNLLGNIAVVNGQNLELNEYGEIVEKCWLEIPQHYPNVILHEFIVMPDHIHGIIEITKSSVESQSAGVQNVGVQNFEPLRQPQRITNTFQHIIPQSIGAIIRGFKIGTTKQIGFSIWQRNFYEQIIRDEQTYQNISQYIKDNPSSHLPSPQTEDGQTIGKK